MPDIRIDATGLTFPFFAIPGATDGFLDGASSPTVSLPVRRGYRFNQGGASLASFEFDVTEAGTIDFDHRFDACLGGRGEQTLTVRGFRVVVDGDALDHGLVPQIAKSSPLTPDQPHELHLAPHKRYRLVVGSGGVTGHLDFSLDIDGTIRLDPAFSGIATVVGDVLTVTGRTVEVDGRSLAHDLLPVGLIGYSRGFLSHKTVNSLTLLPGDHYRFQPGSGVVANFQFGVAPEGTVVLAAEFAPFASASGNVLTVRGHTVRIDGRGLSHGLLPISLGGYTGGFLPRDRVNELVVIPAAGYRFQPGSGVVGDFHYTLALDGTVAIDPKFASFASASGNLLTVRGHTVRIDGRGLSHDLLPISLGGYTGGFLPRDRVNELVVIPAAGYRFQPGSGVVGDFHYTLALDGTVAIDPKFASFASASGNLLTVRGHTVRIDGRGLSHDLLPISLGGYTGGFLPRDRVNELTVVPAVGYRFQPGGGVVADMSYDLKADGTVDYPPSCDRFLSGRGTSTLVVKGYPLLVDATHADSDLVGIIGLRIRPDSPRQLFGVIIPAQGYRPQTRNGVFTHGFNIERDGRITFDPAVAGSYVVVASSSPNPSRPGEEVTFTAAVRPVPPGVGTPTGEVQVGEAGAVLGRGVLDATARATVHVSTLGPGEHDVTVGYGGDEDFQPSASTLRHRVE